MISFQKILGTLHGVSVPKLPIVTGAPETDQRVCQRRVERGSAENSAWAADPRGTLSSRRQGRVSQDDKGKGGETWSSKGQGPGGGEAPGGTGGRIGGQREGARRGVPRMRRSLAKEFRLLAATPVDPV